MALKLGIKSQLLLLGILPASVVALALSGYFIYYQVAGLESRLIDRGNVIAGQLATLASNSLSTQSLQATQSVVNTIILENDVVEASVFDRHGNLIARASSNAHPINSTQERLVFSSPIFGYPNTVTVDAEPSADRSLSSTLDIYRPNENLGHVQISVTRDTIRGDRDTILLNALVITLIGLSATAILARGIGRQISRPIFMLTDAVFALSHGKLNTRVRFSSSGEFGQLKIGFNAMADQLQKYQEGCEQRVYQATVRLQSALQSVELQNAELDKARCHAEAENKNKSRFLAQVSHEIRTPMNGIIGFAEILSKSALSPTQADQVKLIDRSAKNLLGIINEILDLSRLEAGKTKLNVTSFSLRPYLEDAVVLLRPQSTETQIILSIEPNLPKTISNDPAKIQQITVNFLGNAIKFTRKGRIVVRARFLEETGRKSLLISVSDNGRGIDSKGISKLFVPFSQITDQQNFAQQGTGLGLSISKSFTAQVGGQIGVLSRPRVGSTFWMSIPITTHSERTPEAFEFDIGLIDPHPLSANALTYQLIDLKANVTRFPSPSRFLQMAQTETNPKIIILNLSEPNVDNVKEVSRWFDQVKSLGYKPLVMLSHPEVGMLEGVLKMLGIPSLVTPCRSEYLLQTLNALRSEMIRLPDQQFSEKPVSVTAETIPTHGSIPEASSKLKFLVADDNEINRLLIKNQLEHIGATILEADNGEKALNITESTRFDLIFLDLQMPLLNGMEVLKKIKGGNGTNLQTPVIAITAHAMEDERKSLVAEGFAECLIKPILQHQVDQLTDRFLNHASEKTPVTLANAEKTDSKVDERPTEPNEYVSNLLNHTNDNRTLAETIMKKLISELPHQVSVIENSLTHQKWDTAESITHKLHGSFSFCGFNDLKESAATVESLLIRGQQQKAKDAFSHLKEEIEEFIGMENRILGLITTS